MSANTLKTVVEIVKSHGLDNVALHQGGRNASGDVIGLVCRGVVKLAVLRDLCTPGPDGDRLRADTLAAVELLVTSRENVNTPAPVKAATLTPVSTSSPVETAPVATLTPVNTSAPERPDTQVKPPARKAKPSQDMTRASRTTVRNGKTYGLIGDTWHVWSVPKDGDAPHWRPAKVSASELNASAAAPPVVTVAPTVSAPLPKAMHYDTVKVRKLVRMENGKSLDTTLTLRVYADGRVEGTAVPTASLATA